MAQSLSRSGAETAEGVPKFDATGVQSSGSIIIRNGCLSQWDREPNGSGRGKVTAVSAHPPADNPGPRERYTGSAAGRWTMLIVGMLATVAAALMINGAAFLIPALRVDRGMSLAGAGVVVAMPTVGVLLTLFVWGAIVDRVGERRALVTGSVLTSAAAFAASTTESTVTLGLFLLLGGSAAASVNSATGRVVVGWFPAQRRGLAMGIRQMALPLGVAVSALTVPTLADRHGIAAAMLLPAAASALAALACLILVFDPPRPSRSAGASADLLTNPYRGHSVLWRIHGASVLLVVPQYVVWTFALVWLTDQRDWSPAAAGVIITLAQIGGAFGRIAAGVLSDRVGSRMRPMRWIVVLIAVVMAALAAADAADVSVAIALLVVASVATVAPNGLAFTAVAEIAGPFWSGRALGSQNTAQYLAAAAVPPVFGLLIGQTSYAAAFAVCAVLAAAALPVLPRSTADRTG